ncbi:hypothetical protein HQN64_08180 [Enterobacteriaceae bacterium BIT-l23]|uniref:winged helix-turn-helix domain-containing protein n=1 Tax=Jejubacter sp. L23 TaxID=3092086 RepID=UPI001585BA38|nr:hypothetical protein [Enterobacteriaceae bacterium BIT-l23]
MTTKIIPLSSRVTFHSECSCLKVENAQDVYLTPGERKLLELVLEGKGSKENVFEQIWLSRGIIVGESSYHQLIKTLRRKLQSAGLPATVIKTLPRFGLIYVRPDDGAPYVEADVEKIDEESMPSGIAQSSMEASVDMDDRSQVAFPSEVSVTPIPDKHEGTGRHVCLPRWLIVASCTLAVLLPLLVQYLWISGESNFADTLQARGITYHATSEQLLIPKMLEDIVGKPVSGVRHIYLAANGPKVWIAQCHKEINQEKNQCHYKNISIY